MPLVRHGADQWTPEDAAHLAGCGECQLEWELVAAGARLGSELAERFDTDRATRAVVARLTTTARRRRRWIGAAWGVGLAAVASLVLLAWPGSKPAPQPDPVAVVDIPILPLAELDGVDPVVLDEILTTLDDGREDDATLEAPGFSDLAPSELERLLQTMEG
jgi:hypothetical protein